MTDTENTEPIEVYGGRAKENEAGVVESHLAPIVRTYGELGEILSKVSDKTKVATSGFFNPIHKNHISNIVSSKHLDKNLLKANNFLEDVHLTVVVNGDWSAKNKLGGDVFLPAEYRADVVRAIVGVDLVFIHEIEWPYQGPLIAKGLFDIFTKGGDRDFESLPGDEKKALLETGTLLVSNVGYDKKEGTDQEVSSSKLRSIAKGKASETN